MVVACREVLQNQGFHPGLITLLNCKTQIISISGVRDQNFIQAICWYVVVQCSNLPATGELAIFQIKAKYKTTVRAQR